MKTITKKLNSVLATVLTIAALVAGQGAWATTKSVTYKITSVNRNSSLTAYEIVFTRQNDATRTDDDPFDTSAPTTYTTSVLIGSIENNQSGYFSVQLADGFQLNSSWNKNSTVRFMNNCIYPSASDKYITYSVSCSNDNYYVTHVMMTGHNSNYQQGLLQPSPHLNDPIDYDYSSEWHFHNSYLSAYAFGQITITYTDVPLLSIFESDGENAYKIKDKYDLRHLAAYVNNGGNNCSGLTFRQTQAITCDATYVPIGYRFSSSNRSYFKGTYDGQGHTVSGITVSRTGGSEADGCIGLFGYVEYGGTVQNVVLASSTFTGNDKIGGIVGLNWSGTVKNCRVESSVTIKAGCNNAWNHGGIVGYNDSGTIEGCVSAASILNNGKSTHQFCGGITGRTSRTIRNCLYTGTTIEAAAYKGAICGYSDGGATYANNYYTAIALGGVGSTNSSSDQDGARRARTVTLGSNVALAGNETTYEIQNHSSLTAIGSTALSYNDGSATTLYSGATQALNLRYGGEALATGYAAVYSVDGTAIARSTFEVPAGDVGVSVAATDVWGVSGTPAADGSADHPYTISSTYGLDLLAKNVNGTDGYTAADFSGQHFLQTAPITYDGTENNYTPIGNSSHYFKGHYDGQGYTISGIRINRTQDDVGLFGKVDNVGTVKNVILSDARITGGNYTGGIVGTNNGFVKNCVAVGTTIIKKEKYNYGVIVGMTSRPLSNNYYFNCSLGDKDYDIGIGNSEDSDDEYYNDGAIPVNAFPLLSTGINDHVFATNYNVPNKDFTIAGRTLYKDGDWNTLCLPFSLSAGQIAAHERFAGADIRALSSASVANGTLTLNFTAKGAVTSIQAGVPYIVRWDRDLEYEDMPSAYDIKDATFTGVTITSTTPGAVTSTDGKVTFQGTYGYTEYTNEDRSVLFLGTQNRLYYPQPALNDPTQPFDADYNPWIYPSIGSFRAYFKLNDTNAPNLNIVLNFGDGTTSLNEELRMKFATPHSQGENEEFAPAAGWFTINGVKLSEQPTQKGVYIVNGKKVVIK